MDLSGSGIDVKLKERKKERKIAKCERGEKKGKKASQKYKKMTKYLYSISGLSQIWPNLPTHA
jgi:hypothetical protein